LAIFGAKKPAVGLLKMTDFFGGSRFFENDSAF
jgi:hypothetical protein